MEQIYLDNAATTFPKPQSVSDAVYRYMTNIGSNVSRGGYGIAYDAADVVLRTREKLCQLFGFDKPQNVVFTNNITTGINMVLKGLLRPGDHVLCSSMEHNAVMRPLTQLMNHGVAFTRIPSDDQGLMDENAIVPLIQPNTRAVVVTHASNVCGAIMPIERITTICHDHNLFLIVDAAQSAGSLSIDMNATNIDALLFTGHKGLYGPQGTGGILLDDSIINHIEPLLSGGTGSFSDSEQVPNMMPDRFEPGTPNLPGIFGLHAALEFIEEQGINAIHAHEMALCKRLVDGLGEMKKIRLVGPSLSKRTAIVSFDCLGSDNAAVCYALEQHGILCRCGLHCAPHAHKTLDTFPQGTVRLSPGLFNTTEQMDAVIAAMGKILSD